MLKFSPCPPQFSHSEEKDDERCAGQSDDCAGNNIGRKVDANIESRKGDESGKGKERPRPSRQEVCENKGAGEVVYCMRGGKRVTAAAAHQQVNARKHVTGPRPVNEMLQERTVELIAQGDCGDQQERGNPTTLSSFNKQQKPQDADDDKYKRLFVKVGYKRHHRVENDVLQCAVAEIEQASVNTVQDIDQAFFLWQWSINGDRLVCLSCRISCINSARRVSELR